MTEEQLVLLELFIDAKIALAIESAFGRDSLHESLTVWNLRKQVKEEFIK
jgi:hypothetical protein